MIPFPGESAPLDSANVTAGAPFDDFGDNIRFRAGSATVTAGDAFVAGFYDHRYLEAGADAVFSAVVETLPGSSGTLHLTGGPDPDWSLGDTNASAYDLGTHAVTGAQTIVVLLPWLTVADYLAEAVETAVRVECVSGSVVVQQVKLRIWPPTGVVGGWSPTPFVQPPQEREAQIVSASGGDTGILPTQEDVRAAAAALTIESFAAADNYLTSGTFGVGPDGSAGGFGAAYIARSPGRYSGPGFEEEAWIVPPTEVRGDADSVTFQPLAADTTAWTQGVTTIVDNPTGNAAGGADGLFHIDATETTGPEDVGTLFVSFVVGGSFVTYAGADGTDRVYSNVSLPEFDAPTLRVTVWHDGMFGAVGEGGTQILLGNGITTDDVTFDHLRYLWTPAPYRYWNPAAVTTPRLRQRNRDDIRARLRASRQRSIRARGYL